MYNRIFIVISALVVIAISGWYTNLAKAQEIVTKGLVSFWTFDSANIEGATVKDVWGDNDGVIKGAQIVEGKIKGGLEFDGVDDYVDCGSGASLDNLGPLTVEAWIYPHTIGETYGRIYEKVDGAVLYLSATDTIQLAVRYQTTDMDTRGANNSITMNAWQHVAFTWDGSTDPANIHIYVNGTEINYQSSTQRVGGRKNDSAENFLIGNRPATDRTFDGIIDEVKVYNRVLSEAEIKLNYNATSNQLAVVKPVSKLAIKWGKIKAR